MNNAPDQMMEMDQKFISFRCKNTVGNADLLVLLMKKEPLVYLCLIIKYLWGRKDKGEREDQKVITFKLLIRSAEW